MLINEQSGVNKTCGIHQQGIDHMGKMVQRFRRMLTGKRRSRAVSRGPQDALQGLQQLQSTSVCAQAHAYAGVRLGSQRAGERVCFLENTPAC